MSSQLYDEDVCIGMEVPMITKTPTPVQLVKWAGASGDYNPIHYNHFAALAQKLPGIIVHGKLKTSYLCQMLTDWIGDQGNVVKISCQHRGMDVPDHQLKIGGRVTGVFQKDGQNLVECEIWVENDKGQKTVPGAATVSLPTRIG
ncbi:MAG: acyl dehydratase [Chloroflexi bacterium]|nr:acyl dehydratase [Chloroflexota bacterium]